MIQILDDSFWTVSTDENDNEQSDIYYLLIHITSWIVSQFYETRKSDEQIVNKIAAWYFYCVTVMQFVCYLENQHHLWHLKYSSPSDVTIYEIDCI